MNTEKKISVIMGIYNCSSTLAAAIESILSQTYDNFELIICDDGSVDRTYEIAKAYADINPEKIKLIKNKKNIKLAATLNRCLEYAKGDYIARMDGDDISVAERFEKQTEFLNTHPEYDLVGTQMISFDETGDVGVREVIGIPDKKCLVTRNPFAHATIMCRRNVYSVLKGYSIETYAERCEDMELWFRFFAHGFKGYNLQLPLYKVRETAADYKRRKLKYGFGASKVLIKGYRLLGYPLYLYPFALKPILAYALPTSIMKAYHNKNDKNTASAN
ncbi:MAG: glycosyltransferase [Oscillospiraceae bacterium]|nr:glycosyltransferase [Oscillospiraceae bacterium]